MADRSALGLFVKRVAAVMSDVVELLDDGGVAVNGKPRTAAECLLNDIGNGAGATAGIRRHAPRTRSLCGDCPAALRIVGLGHAAARQRRGAPCRQGVATGQERRHLVREGESVCHTVSVTRIPTLSLLDLLRRTAGSED